MVNATAVAVGLDVHKSSARLCTLCDGELLDERMLPYDAVAMQRALSRWPGARVCCGAGLTGFGLYNGI